MTDELKPVRCGCGGEARVIMLIPEVYAVECSNCYIRTGSPASTEAEAIQAWNRAMGSTEKSSVVERTAKVEAVEKPIIGDTEGKTIKVTSCGNCKNTVSIFDNFCPGCGCRLIWGDEHE